MKRIKIIIMSWNCLFFLRAFGQDLDFPDKIHSFETLSSQIQSVFLSQDELLSLSSDQKSLFLTPFSQKTNFLPPPLLSYKRLSLPKGSRINGVLSVEQFVFWDGSDLSLRQLSSDGKELAYHSIIWDGIRPSPDPRGEAPLGEIQEFQKMIRSYWERNPDQKIFGLSPMDKHRYLLISKIQKAPIMIMDCDPKNLTRCEIQRGCSIDQDDFSFQNVVHGVFIKEEKKIYLLIGHKIVSMLFDSCFQITGPSEEWTLPKNIKSPSAIFFDTQGRLWVSSKEKDDYLNASIYFWKIK